MSAGSLELESTVKRNVDFLRRRLTLGKKKNRLYIYGCYQKKNVTVLETVHLVTQKTAKTNTIQNSRRSDTSLQ